MRSFAAMLGLVLLCSCEHDGQATSPGPADPAATPEQLPHADLPTPTSIAEVPELNDPPPEAPSEPSPELQPDEDEYVEPEPPPVPQAPQDYGQIKPPDPLPGESDLTRHALVGYEVVAVYAKPDKDSPRLGYMRLGSRLKVTDKVAGKGCSGAWYGLPKGGYACSGRGGGLVVDAKRPPYMHREPPPPRMEQALPYDYAKIRKWNTPMYWRVPTAAERNVVAERRADREAMREGKPLPSELAAAKAAAAKAAAAPPTAAASPSPASAPKAAPAKPKATPPKAAPAKTDPAKPLAALPKPPGADDKAKPPAKAPAAKPTPAKAADSKPTAAKPTATKPTATKPTATKAAEPKPAEEVPEVAVPKPPLSVDTPWLERGFFVSLADQVEEEGAKWWRTARGAYIPAAAVGTYPAKDHQGTVLDVEADFPFGYAMAKAPQLVELTDEGKLRVSEKIDRRTFLDLSEETEVDGRAYMVTTDGLLIRKDHVRFAERQPLPEGIQPWERWIDVDLTKQVLVAYEGERPVFTTLVSTGRKGTKEEPFDTPTGRWRIRSKHVSTTMDGPTASDGNYSIQDVPWTMYFYGSYALHGAFWHDGFGRVRSHGCVNLGPSDAQWIFNWTTPFLPEGWHGVNAHDGSPGTTVVVRKSERK